MTPTELLSEIQKLPLSDVQTVADEVSDYLRQHREISDTDDVELKEDEFERYLLATGLASHIATRGETDEEFDSFELINVEGEPLSETIIRERR
jgi:hypothetical protein